MQPITWTETEFKERVARKLAVLKGIRAAEGASFGERLALAEDRMAFDEAKADATVRNAAACSSGRERQTGRAQRPTSPGNFMSTGNNSMLGSIAFSRVTEPDDSTQDESTRRTGYTAADDSYGASAAGGGAHDGGSDPKNGSDNGDEADITAAKASQQRLLEANLRQTSADWVVLDRAKVLQLLLTHPEGLTLVGLARLLLGANATPRDTRRLSAMMAREEIRETVTRVGRGQPIKLTTEGADELKRLDVAAESRKSVHERKRQLKSQQERLKGALAKVPKPQNDN